MDISTDKPRFPSQTAEYRRAKYTANAETERARSRQWRARHPAYRYDPVKALAAGNRWRTKNKFKVLAQQKARNIKKMYGLSVEEFTLLLKNQEGGCAICGRKTRRALSVDHDHATGRVRGLLCNLCNTGLGQFKDDPVKLHKAIQYLVKHSH